MKFLRKRTKWVSKYFFEQIGLEIHCAIIIRLSPNVAGSIIIFIFALNELARETVVYSWHLCRFEFQHSIASKSHNHFIKISNKNRAAVCLPYCNSHIRLGLFGSMDRRSMPLRVFLMSLLVPLDEWMRALLTPNGIFYRCIVPNCIFH